MDSLLSLLEKSPGAIAVLIVVLGLFIRGIIVTATSCDNRVLAEKARADQYQKERDEWRNLAMDGMQTGQRAITIAERFNVQA